MLERFGRATLHSAPTRHELILGHLAYLVGLALLAWVVAGLAGRATPSGIGTALEAAGVGAALGFLCLFWAVRVRQTAPEPWFFSHLVWLSLTYARAFVAVAVSTLGVILGLVVAAIVPPVAALIGYAPLVAGGLLTTWFAWRMVRGYCAYWRRAQVGHLVGVASR
ncbi:MAG TPA: hypothetical protein VK845_15420 [Gemmatimonadales bacterium]|nr:hypothetical protein [Gemmatimonadales bacterium]